MKKFLTKTYLPDIKEIEIERETESSVWIAGRKHAKISEHEGYFDSREQAKQWRITKAQIVVDKAQRQLKYAEKLLTEAQNLI